MKICLRPGQPLSACPVECVLRAARPQTFGFELTLYLFSGHLNSRTRPDQLKIKELEHVRIEKVEQLFLDML